VATTTHPAATAGALSSRILPAWRTNPLAAALNLWHLLSLDAPSVAMLWTWFIARSNRIALSLSSVAAMGIAVWILYAADRLLDARLLDARTGALTAGSSQPPDAGLEARHYFHRIHRRAFRAALAAATVALALMVPHLDQPAIRLYLVLAALLIVYSLLIHANGRRSQRLPKELAVGVFFSAAAFIPTVSRDPSLRPILLPVAVVFAAVCSLNCLFIYAWEHTSASPAEHAATRLALRFLRPLALSTIAIGLTLSLSRHPGAPIALACAIAAALLLLLDRNRIRLSRTTLRAAADLCLLTPLLLLAV
jgi:hypothetical protein